MYDPMTVAFEIKMPWPRKTTGMNGYKYYPPLVTIWHVDPERRGDDDSCDWWGSHRKLNAKEKAIVEQMWVMESTLDNRPFYPDHRAHKDFQELKRLVREWQRRPRFRWRPRWHFWHWKIQIPVVQDLKRWLWSRCKKCGKGFPWGYAPCSDSWNAPGPRWFRGERDVYHHNCADPKDYGIACESKQ